MLKVQFNTTIGHRLRKILFFFLLILLMIQVAFFMCKKVNIFYDILYLDLVENEYYIMTC